MSDRPAAPRCADCRFWEKAGGLRLGLSRRETGACRRFPPQRMYTEDGIASDFPTVASDAWCGEFAARPA